MRAHCVTALADRPRVPRQMGGSRLSQFVECAFYARRPNERSPFCPSGYSRLAGGKCNLCQTRRVVTDVTATPNTSRNDWLLFLALGFLWGSSYLFIKIGVDAGLTPFTLIMLRLLIGFLLLATVFIAARESLPGQDTLL